MNVGRLLGINLPEKKQKQKKQKKIVYKHMNEENNHIKSCKL